MEVMASGVYKMKVTDKSIGRNGLRLNHIGLVVESIEAAADALFELGLKKKTIPEKDHIQKVNAVFIDVVPGQDVFIELLEPIGEDSPITPFLRKGGGLHHICFEVSDIEKTCSSFIENGYRCISEPTDCKGFDKSFGMVGSRIAFFLAPIRLLIELVEKGDLPTTKKGI
jgi:methylmalonyl-CoA/ethylmalonyl-CoA epimerase